MTTTTSPQPSHAPSTSELEGLFDYIPGAGPPALVLAAPVVLFGLLLVGPFVVILTLVAVLALAAGVVALAGWLIASPFLLVRHLRRRHGAAPATGRRPARPVVPARSRSAVA